MLSLSLTTGYALKALSCLGGGDCPTRHIADVARCAQVPRPYLAKVMNLLVRASLVATKRGYRGGISLTRPASEISLLDIVVAVEGEQWMGDCLLGLDDCRTPGMCPTMAFWTHIRSDIRNELGRLSLADLINSRSALAGGLPSRASSSRSSLPSACSKNDLTLERPATTIA